MWSDEDEVYTIRVYHYPGGEAGIQVLDKTKREEPAAVEVYTTLPVRHIDPRK